MIGFVGAGYGKQKKPRRNTSGGALLRWGNLLRHEDGVDHVNHAVGAHDVGLRYRRIIDLHGAAVGADGERLAVDRFCGMQLHGLSGSHFASDDVIGEDGDELLLIFRLEEFVDGASGKFREGVVRWREDGERAFALWSINKPRRF